MLRWALSVVELFEECDNNIFWKQRVHFRRIVWACYAMAIVFIRKIAYSKFVFFEHTIWTGAFRIQICDLNSSFGADRFISCVSAVQVWVCGALWPLLAGAGGAGGGQNEVHKSSNKEASLGKENSQVTWPLSRLEVVSDYTHFLCWGAQHVMTKRCNN